MKKIFLIFLTIFLLVALSVTPILALSEGEVESQVSAQGTEPPKR